jgi:hypothetical protein
VRDSRLLLSRSAVLAAFALVATAAFLLRARADDLRQAPPDTGFDIPPFPAEVSRPFSFGLRSLVADLTFLEAIQVYGGLRKPRSAAAGAADDRTLNRLLTYSTDLDPKFAGAYRFAGNAMPRNTTDGKATNVFQAETLLKKGAVERPDDWKIPFALGFIESYYLGHFQEAGRNLARAAATPGSPAYLPLLATRASAEGGDLDFAEQMARHMGDQATEESTKEEWQRRLLALRMERDLRALDAAVASFQQLKGQKPHTLRDLVRAGVLAAVPAEPHGGAYELSPQGEPRSNAVQRLRIRGRVGTTAGLEVQ